MKELTIVIPTYNRRERLLNLLHSLYVQPEVMEVSILILDNHSNYDVKEIIEKEFPKEFTDNIEVVRNRFNIGMNANLASVFLYPQTKWIWTIGDDDEATENSLSIILKDVKKHPKTSLLKYSVDNIKFDEQIIRTLPEFISYVKERKYPQGPIIFLSNNVYNMEYVEKYLGNTLSNCYSAIGHMLPAFNALNSGEATIIFRDTEISRFYSADENMTWSYLNTIMGLRTVPGFDNNLTHKQFCDFQVPAVDRCPGRCGGRKQRIRFFTASV